MAEETKIIRIVVDSSRAVDGSAATTRALERMERAQSGVTASFSRLEGVFRSFFGTYLGMSGANAIIRAADAFTTFSNALRVAGVQGEALAAVQGRLYAAANKNGVEVGVLGQVYSRIAMSSKELGASQSDILKFTDGVTAALRVQGGSAEQASGALLQLSQAMGAGVVRAEEFNSILEGALPIAQAAARGMDGMGGSVAKLRAAVIAGTVTSREFFDGLLKGFEHTKVQAEGASLTIGGALTGLNNNFERFIGGIDQATGASGKMVSVIDSLSRGLERLGSIARAAKGDVLGMFAIASNPAMLINMAFAKSPVESLTGQIDDLQKKISEADARLAKDPGRGADVRLRGQWQSQLDALERQRSVLAVGGKALPSLSDDPDNIGLVIARPPLPPLTKKGEGGGDGNRYAEALQDAQRNLEQARAFADIADQGAAAVERMEIRFKALKTSQDVFSKTANDNSAAAQALAASLEETGLATQKLKNLGDFRADTATLRDQNELLEAEVRLANELPEVRARELAILKTMQEVKAKGLEGETEAIEQRRQAIEQNERLKAQGEEIKRSTELWTAPFKSALESIQRSTADWIESMLQGLEQGKFSMADFGKIGLSVLRRMAAEIISLGVMRPMLGSVVNGLASTGIISPGMASSLGYGSTGGGGGGFSLPGGSGLGNMFGGGGFFSQPVASLFSSGAPAGGYSSVGALLQSGNTGASAAASGIGGLGGISIGSALGAIGGIGMGAYQLFNSRSTGQTLGGIGSMIGAGVSLIPGIGQIAGPLIMMASALLPSLFGEPNTRTHSSTNASLRYGNGNWYTTGGAYGPGANSGESESALRGTTAGIDSVFSLLGGVKDPSRVWGLNLNSWTAQGKNWSYTSRDTSLVDPATGNREAWRMNMDDMMDTGAAQVAIRSILSGAIGEISSTMKTALEAMRAAAMGIKETAESIVFVDEVYERLGKGALTVRTQFRELEKSFSDMTAKAEKLGLSLAPIEAEQKKATERLGRDYVDNLIDPIAASLRAWEDEKQSILANVDYIAKHTDVVVDMARINEALLRKEAALKEQLYGGSIAQLEEAIRRLSPGGDLANLAPSGTLAGLKASYQATYAQAAAGDAAAIGRFGAESTAYAEYSKSYFAGSPAYEAIKAQIVEALQTVQAAAVGPVMPSADPAATASNPNGAQMQQLMATINNLVAELQAERAESAKLRAVLSRYVTTQAA